MFFLKDIRCLTPGNSARKKSKKVLTGASEATSLPFLPDGRVRTGLDEKKVEKGVDGGKRKALSSPSCLTAGSTPDAMKKLKKVLTGVSEISSFPFLPDGGTFIENHSNGL
ncbi:MAG: hypothetical protein ABIK45_04585 [Pseudomonadota bacterium]